jgi:hypothetical protein
MCGSGMVGLVSAATVILFAALLLMVWRDAGGGIAAGGVDCRIVDRVTG